MKDKTLARLCPLYEKYRKHIELVRTKITSHFTSKTVNLLHETVAFSVMQLQTWKTPRLCEKVGSNFLGPAQILGVVC